MLVPIDELMELEIIKIGSSVTMLTDIEWVCVYRFIKWKM